MSYLRLLIYSCITIIISLSYSFYLHLSREASLWWSNITDIEKLISFRTEQGLYYSFFQEFINQDNPINGVYVLFNNNMTEYPQKINVIKRMNVWQEICLGCLYMMVRYTGLVVSPIEFYTNSVLLLQGILISSIFLLSSSINNSILAGLLTVVFFALNRGMTSRIAYTIPLRESFALPFWWLHVLTLHTMIRPERSTCALQSLVRVLFNISTFLFCLQWQFSQFVILLECCVMFLLNYLEYISPSLTRRYYMTCLIGIIGTALLQMGNSILVSSLPVALIISSLLLDCIKTPKLMKSSFSGRITWISIQGTGRIIISIIIKMLLNCLLQQSDDSHIFHFLLAKFGIGRTRDFQVNLYLCHEGFKWLSIEQFIKSMKMVNIPYLITYFSLSVVFIISSITVLWHDTEEEEDFHPNINETTVGAEGDFCDGCDHLLSNQPELAYHFGLNTVSLLLALIVQRMQYFLVPYIIIFASMAYGHTCLYCNIVQPLSDVIGLFSDSPINNNIHNNDIKITASRRYNLISRVVQYSRQAIVIAVICTAAFEAIYSIQLELTNLREFYDPDTVELMKWIKLSTSANESFSGSMQLMAAVKLIAERPIVNHPHFEDADLRSKTKMLYQIYARQPAEYVYKILKYYQVNYIIVEDSICLAKTNGCQLKDLLDLDNGHMPEKRYYSDYDLYFVNVPRFCDAIRHVNSFPNNSFNVFFREMFLNPTFRVYQVI